MNLETGTYNQTGNLEIELLANHLVKPVPYSLDLFIPYIGENNVNKVIEESHLYDPRIVGWDLIRKRGNMITTASPLSGLEGYLIAGLAHEVRSLPPEEQKRYDTSPLLTPYKNFDIEITDLSLDEMNDFICQEGNNAVASIKREIPSPKRSLIWNSLAGEGKISIPALVEIETRFKSLLARMRAIASLNPLHKRVIKPEIESAIQGTHVTYTMKDGLPVKQHLPNVKLGADLQRILASSDGGYGTDIDPSTGFGYMNLIGKVGNPIIRAALNAIDPDMKRQMSYYMKSQDW